MKEKSADEGEGTVKRKRLLFSVVIILLLSLFLSGCALGHSAWWKEEVLLHDGRTIIVDRAQKLGGYRTLDAPAYARIVLEEKWDFPVPGTRKVVTWRVNQDWPPEGQSLTLITVDFLQGTPYIATWPGGTISYNYWGRPNPPYVFFKYDGKSWLRIPLEEFPKEFTEANVVVGQPRSSRRTGTLSVAQIKEENNRGLEPYLTRIIRSGLSEREVGYPELVTDGKGRWVSIGRFDGQQSYEACVMKCEQERFLGEFCPCKRLFNNKTKTGGN